MADECLSLERQCELLGLARSSYYYQPATETAYNLELMQLIDQQHLRTPFYGVRMMRDHLQRIGHNVNVKRIRRLFRLMGLEALVPQPNSSQRHPEHTVYPYLLRGVEIVNINQVWSTDITYVPMASGFFYLVAVIDWYSRFVLSWRLSNSLETRFCLDALEEALDSYGRPEIFNTDQGAQFTAQGFTDVLKTHQIRISMDGRGRALDNVFIERLWRSYKYEYLYLNLPENGRSLYEGTAAYFQHFNFERPHSSLEGQSPVHWYMT